jgi:outer membrane protein assembly factor BamB
VTLTRDSATQTIDIAADGSSVSLDVALLDNTYPAGDHTLVELTVAGQQTGTTTVQFDSVAVGTADGPEYTLTSRSDATVTVSALTQRWAEPATVGRQLQYARPAVTDGHLYLGGLDSTVTRQSTTDGTADESWQPTRAGSLSDSAPVVRGDDVYIGSGGGVLYAFDQTAESPRWEYQIESAITSTPATTTDAVYVAANDGTVHAVDRTNGDPIWQQPTDVGAPVYTALTAATGFVVLTTTAGQIIALDSADGSVVWEDQTDREFTKSAPTVSDGTVFVAASTVRAYKLDSGQLRWQHDEFPGTAGASPAVDGTTVYAAGTDGTVHALTTSDGVVEWTVETGGSITADPITTSQGVLTCTADGNLVLTANNGSKVDTLTLDSSVSTLVAASGTVYASTTEGVVTAVEIPTDV